MAGDVDVASDWLIGRHFSGQDDRPAGYLDVPIPALHPLLRSLLFSDGTVTRALEAQILSPLTVRVVHQAEGPTPALAARLLELPPGSPSINRRVAIAAADSRHLIWADSYIVPARLPAVFGASLATSVRGIGESLQRTRLEGCRELLWFGLGPEPDWATPPGDADPAAALTRQYRVLTRERPALLISESFPVEEEDGVYRLGELPT